MKNQKRHTILYLAGLIVLLFFFCNKGIAQEKNLKTVRIKHRRENKKSLQDERLNSFTPGMKMMTIDSQLMAQYSLQSLSNLLSQQVPVFIRSYGINSLATLNFRGSSSAQSQVLWNGIPLNNASLGMADISVLSVNHFENINILYGGSSALTGSGNVGAALLLDNKFRSNDSSKKTVTTIALEAGSFQQLKIALREEINLQKVYISIKATGQSAENNFRYKDQNNSSQKMSHAQLTGYSGMLNLGYSPDSKTQLHLSAWYQHFDRELPAALFEKFSAKQQIDKSLRLFFEAKKLLNGNTKLYSKSAFISDAMQYEDSAVKLFTNNKTFQFYEEMGWKKEIKQHELLLFAPINISWTRPLNDSQTRYQNKIAIAGAYRFSGIKKRLNIAVNGRLEQINRQTVLLPGLNVSYSIFPFITLRGNIQKSFRAPTLNEWYYQPGGNSMLKPEKGWSEDIGYELKIPVGRKLIFNHDFSAFNRNIRDWIVWFGGSIWTPHNIAEVHSRGFESVNSLVWQQQKLKIHIGLNTSFVLATTEKSYIPADGSIGKQIPYSPRYNFQSNFGLNIGKIYVNYNHTYTGYRFVTTDESQFLKPYQTGNLYISFQKSISAQQLKISLQCNNLWDNTYQVVYLRPMPGRNMSVVLNWTF
ncbi:MAG: TonB-dependent receptor [Chitinophagaceae bacterium]